MTGRRAGARVALALTMALVSVGGACAVPRDRGPRATELPAEPVVLPTRVSRGLWLLRAELPNLPGRHWLLLDSGTDRMLLDLRTAQRIGLQSRADDTVRTATGGAMTSWQLDRLPWLQAGDARFVDIEVAGVDLGPLRETGGLPIVGIVGCDMFRQSLLEMDYPRRRARVLPRASAPTTPALHFAERLPHVTLEAAGTRIRALVDTGFQHPLAVPPDLPLRWQSAPRRDGDLATLDGVTAKSTARLAGDLVVGDLRLRQPRVVLAPGSPKIGAALLRDCRVLFDAAGGRLWIEQLRGEAPASRRPAARSPVSR